MAQPRFWNNKDSDKIRLEREATQGDNISPRLFTSCLQDTIIKSIYREARGLSIDREHLSHLIFVDDIILLAKTLEAVNGILTDIHKKGKPVGLNVHRGKTKVMFNDHVNESVNSNRRWQDHWEGGRLCILSKDIDTTWWSTS